jgi:hypothetical protein
MAERTGADIVRVGSPVERVAKRLIGLLMSAEPFDLSPLAVIVRGGAIAVPPVQIRLIAKRVANDPITL